MARYTEQELQQYFNDPAYRRTHGNGSEAETADGPDPRSRSNGAGDKPPRGVRGYFYRRLKDPRKAEAAFVLSILTSLILLGTLVFGIVLLTLMDDMPSLSQIESPELDLATVAYTADGVELGRFGRQNRSWVAFEDISPHVINALVATEDHRFPDHWGIDVFRTFSAVAQTVLYKLHIPGFEQQGGSTITQQLARNLYNEQIGSAVTITRKMKEWVTAVQLERRYTKQEILEMYLNTVPFPYNAYGIEAAARTFFGKTAAELDVLESATLVGMLKGTTIYNPVRNPERSRDRRNVVMRQMIKNGFLTEDYYQQNKVEVTPTDFRRTGEVTESYAPYFAEYVRNWLSAWGKENGRDVYAEGLTVYTTLDSRLQEFAQASVEEQGKALQAVVDCEWSARSNPIGRLGLATGPYLEADCDPFAYFWSSKKSLIDQFIKETERYRKARNQGQEPDEIVAQLRENEAFMDSLKAEKTRLEAGLLSIDPRTGYVKAWVGGRDLKTDWYDHVATAKRQPGSTFKPFLYTAAIDNGYSPYYTLQDTAFTYVDVAGNVWSPGNSGEPFSGDIMTLREGLARSKNTISGRLILEIEASTAAFYARRMGVESPLDEVPSLALGVSDVSLLELTTGYATLASGGIRHDPIAVTRILDSSGNVLYEAQPVPREALSEETAYTVIDMMRDVIDQPYGTGQRIRHQFGLYGYDFAGKTGTTQESADGWFMLMHPELVTGAWTGFNDRRVVFRSNFWGQGAHNALFFVGDYLKRAADSDEMGLTMTERFPLPEDYDPTYDEFERERMREEEKSRGRVGW